jgi:hypothetical protein
MHGFSPIGGGTLGEFFAPTLIDPYIQWQNNKDWRGKNIYKTDLYFSKGTPHHMRGFPYKTTDMSKQITKSMWDLTGHNLDVNPALIDHFGGQWTGGAGRFIKDVAEIGLSPWQGLPEVHRLPFIKLFVGKNYGSGSYSIAHKYWYNTDREVYNQDDVDRFYEHLGRALAIGRIDEDRYDKWLEEFREGQYLHGWYPDGPKGEKPTSKELKDAEKYKKKFEEKKEKYYNPEENVEPSIIKKSAYDIWKESQTQ